MEILEKNVASFQLLDLYGKNVAFFLAIGLIWVWTYKGMVQVATRFQMKKKFEMCLDLNNGEGYVDYDCVFKQRNKTFEVSQRSRKVKK